SGGLAPPQLELEKAVTRHNGCRPLPDPDRNFPPLTLFSYSLYKAHDDAPANKSRMMCKIRIRINIRINIRIKRRERRRLPDGSVLSPRPPAGPAFFPGSIDRLPGSARRLFAHPHRSPRARDPGGSPGGSLEFAMRGIGLSGRTERT